MRGRKKPQAPQAVSIDASAYPTLEAVTNFMATTFQWRRCDSAGSNCSNISGATSPTYTLGSADTGSSIRVVADAVTSNAWNASVQGSPIYFKNYEDGQLVAGTWQKQDSGFFQSVGRCVGSPCLVDNINRGTITLDSTTSDTGSNSGKVHLLADTARRQAAEQTTIAGARVALPSNPAEYYSLAFRISSYNIPMAEISQINYQGINAAPLLLRMTNNNGTSSAADKAHLSLVLSVYAGEHSQSHVIPYFSGRPGDPSRNVAPAGPYFVIPANNIDLLTWYEVILYVKWSFNIPGGEVGAWWRVKGTSTWTQSFLHTVASGAVFPTVQWGWSFDGTSYTNTSSLSGYGTTDKFGMYREPASTDIDIWHDNWSRSPSFGVAEAMFS